MCVNTQVRLRPAARVVEPESHSHETIVQERQFVIERVCRHGEVWRTKKMFHRHHLRAIAELALRAQRWSQEELQRTRDTHAQR